MLKRKTIKCTGKKKGQSTVEYILLAATIIAALIIFFSNSISTGPSFSPASERMICAKL